MDLITPRLIATVIVIAFLGLKKPEKPEHKMPSRLVMFLLSMLVIWGTW